jgi:hypothetical protein
MNLSDLRAAARRRLDDTVQPYGWTDEDLDAWINEACREASLRGNWTRQSLTVAVVSGTATTTLDASVVYVERIKLASDGRILTRTTRDWIDARCFNWEEITGTPTRFFIQGRELTLYPKPDANDTLTMEALCTPDLLTSNSAEPDLDEFSHRHLLEWVVYRAGQQRDVDFTLPNPEQYESNFTRYFGPRPSARVLQAWLESGSSGSATQ